MGEMYTAMWAFWSMVNVFGVLIAGVEWWCARNDAREAVWYGAQHVDAELALARAQGRVQVMLLMALCWGMVSALAWLCFEGVVR